MDPFQGPAGGKLKLTATVQLGVALAASIWQPDLTGVFGVLGILAVVLSNTELLRLYFYFTPSSILVDVLQLAVFNRPSGFKLFLLIKLMGMVVKLAGTWFAYDLTNLTAGSAPEGYQAYHGHSPGAARRNDPFNAYSPPPANPNLYSQPAASAAAPSSGPPQLV